MEPFKIRTRGSWKAKAPRPRTRQSPSAVREVFIHWPGGSPASWRSVNTVAEEQATMRQIQEFHMGGERGWSDFAYSFAVFQSGRVYRGRGMGYVPAAQQFHNTNTVAVVCFIGPNDTPSDAMRHALRSLVNYIQRKATHTVEVRGHGEVTSTECPGPRLRALVPELDRVGGR